MARSTRICAQCGTTYPIRDPRCPDCGTHNARARDDEDDKGQYIDPTAWRCTWQHSIGGGRCNFPGAIRVGDTKGGGRGLCRHHYAADGKAYADWVVERSHEYDGGEHPATRDLMREYAEAEALRLRAVPARQWRDEERL